MQASAQVDFGEPELDANILNTKQYQRILDYSASRKTNGTNGDRAKWEAWQLANKTFKKSANIEPWQNYGPDTVSGRIISIAFHPFDTNTMLVGSASGGLWRTTDYGNNWEVLTDDNFTMGIGAVAYNPQNPNSILIATGEGYAFGNEFTAGYGVMISHDAGYSWDTTSITTSLYQSFAGMDIHWNSVDTNKVCIASSFGMYYSSDGGKNYTYVLDRIGGRLMTDPSDPNRLYFTARYYNATYPGGLYISTNSGASWTFGSNNGLPPPDEFGYASISIHPTYNHIIYISVSQSPVEGTGPLKGLFKSTDYGATFSQIIPSIDYLCYHPPYQYICQGWFANTILISPSDTSRLFAGGCRLWTSSDGGSSWEACDVNSAGTAYTVHPDHHQTFFHPLSGDLIDCNDGGVNYSSDNGETWNNISDGLITHQFYSIAFAKTDPDVVIGGTQDVGTFSSTSAHTGGWNNDRSGDSFGHVIDHTDENTWYGTNFMNERRMKTVNSGENWFQINNGTSGADQWRMPMVMHPTDNYTLLSSNNDFIYKTVDGGLSWSAVSFTGNIGTLEYDKLNNNLVYAHQLNGGTMYRSVNGGNSWTQLDSSPGYPITDLATDPWIEGTIYATIGSFEEDEQVFISNNRGDTWSSVSSNLPKVPCLTIAVSTINNQEIYVGTDIGVWMSQDGGVSWEDFNEGLPAAVVVDDLHYYEPDSTIRIGTYGRGYWRTKANSIGVGVNEHAVEQRIQVYPNPTTGVITIQALGIKSIEVLDLQGKQIYKGKQTKIDLSQEPNGIYIIKVISDKKTITRILIKQ